MQVWGERDSATFYCCTIRQTKPVSWCSDFFISPCFSYVLTGTSKGLQETFGTTCHGAVSELNQLLYFRDPPIMCSSMITWKGWLVAARRMMTSNSSNDIIATIIMMSSRTLGCCYQLLVAKDEIFSSCGADHEIQYLVLLWNTSLMHSPRSHEVGNSNQISEHHHLTAVKAVVSCAKISQKFNCMFIQLLDHTVDTIALCSNDFCLSSFVDHEASSCLHEYSQQLENH